VPIIVLSSRDDENGKVQALDAAADDYVTKPFGVKNWSPASAPRAPSRPGARRKPVVPVRGPDVDLVHGASPATAEEALAQGIRHLQTAGHPRRQC